MDLEEQKTNQEINTPAEQPATPEAIKHTSHTYDDDLAKAMDATDAKVVQEMLSTGREREQINIEEKNRKSQKLWYRAGSIILIIFTIMALSYGIYHYKSLTVTPERSVSVGVFPSTDPILASTTDIRKVVESLRANTNINGKPTLVPIVSDEKKLTILSVSEIFSFFEAQPTEPLLASFNIVRLGVMNTGIENVPFIIASVPNTEVASKELLIAEPDLLKMLYKPLGIDISQYNEEIGKGFNGEYMYNIPVRTLRYDTKDKNGNLLFLYGRATDQIVVFTTKPEVLKAIYDSIISQQN